MTAFRVATLALTVLVGACAEPDKDVPPSADGGERAAAATTERVDAERVGSARLQSRITASGSIAARRVTELGAEVPGPLLAIHVDVGSTVAQGAELFRIDPGPYEMALAEARAALALARAEARHAEQEEKRVDSLLASRSVSKQHYEQVRTQAEVARARVKQMEARSARAGRDLERTRVRAPYAGSIVARLAHEGAMAGNGPVLVLQESGALEAVVNVPEATPVPVRPGDPVELFVEALDHPLASHVDRVSDRIDPATRTYEVRCPVPDPSRTVKAGAYVRAELAPARPRPQPVVARDALLTRDGQPYVLRVVDGVVAPVAVRVGVVDEQRAELLDGIAAGDVVVRGEAVRRLAPGQRVEAVLDASAQPVATAASPADPAP